MKTSMTLPSVMIAPLLLSALLAPVSALAQAAPATASAPPPPSVQTDTRVRTVAYAPDAIVQLGGCLNFQTMIHLGEDEHIDNVGIGDSSKWQVIPNKRGDLLFVKPLSQDAYSNMTVVTDKRVYNFELRTDAPSDCSGGNVVYELRFLYPPDPATPAAGAAPGSPPGDGLPSPQKRNTDYTYTGASDLIPLRVFDDGQSTFMRWADGVATPAIYAVGQDGSESLVNYGQKGDYLIVEQVARAFVLRRGEFKAVLYNDAYKIQGLDADSPKPRAKDQEKIK